MWVKRGPGSGAFVALPDHRVLTLHPETMSGDNEDAHSPEESPTEEKVRFIAPLISSNMSAVDIVMALRSV